MCDMDMYVCMILKFILTVESYSAFNKLNIILKTFIFY